MKKLLCAMLALALCLAGFAQAEALLNEYELVGKLSEDRYLVRRDGVWGMADDSGWIVLEPALRDEPRFEDGYAVAAILSDEPSTDISAVEEFVPLYGVIDEAGAVCIPFEYDSLTVSEGVALVQQGGEYHYLTLDGEPLNGETYFRADPFIGGYAAVAESVESAQDTSSDPYNALWGVIDRQGSVVIPCQYDRVTLSESGPALVSTHDDSTGGMKYGYVNMDGAVAIPLEYDSAEPFICGIAAVCKRIEGRKDVSDSDSNSAAWGVIDPEGNEILPLEYDSVTVRDDGTIETYQSGEILFFTVRDGKAVPTDTPK